MGTKRITVKEFRAMSDEMAREFWLNGDWPFDLAIGCNDCLTQHLGPRPMCDVRGHGRFRDALAAVLDESKNAGCYGTWLKTNASKLFALRKKFDRLYVSEVSK